MNAASCEDRLIGYRVSAPRPGAHVFEVTLTVSQPEPTGQRVALPAWIPGSYLIRDFARHIMRISAKAGDETVEVRKLDKSTWQCAPCAGPLEIAAIAPEKLTSLVVDEDLYEAGEEFPHIYGPIDADAIVDILPFERGADGYVLPEGLPRR